MHETLPNPHEQLPTMPGIHHVDIETQTNALFELDSAIANAENGMVPFDTAQELVTFLTGQRASETYVLNNDDGKHVGCVSIICEPGVSSAEVLSIGVLTEEQGKGYGKVMMRFAEDMARAQNCNRLTLVAKADNHSAIGFYQHLGFSITGHRTGASCGYDDALRAIMEKRLA